MHSIGLFGSSKLTARAVVIVLAAGMLGAGVAVVAPADTANAASCSTAATGYAVGAGTSGNPYQIASPAELIYLSLTRDDWTEKYFLQMADINLGGCEWSPIGRPSTPFTGFYNGGGKVISGLSITTATPTYLSQTLEYVGMFAFIKNSRIENLTLRGNISIPDTSGLYFVGSLVGLGFDTLGFTTVVSKVRSEVSITTTNLTSTGGIVGEFDGTMEYSSFVGSMQVNASSGSNSSGGLSGWLRSSSQIENSYARVSYSGTSTLKTGINGRTDMPITKSYSASSGVNAAFVHSGPSSGPLSINSFWDSVLAAGVNPQLATSNSLAGVTGKTTAEMKSISTFSSGLEAWDIVNGWETFSTASPAKIWGICSAVNDGYPFLLWEYTTNPCTSAPGAPTISAITAGNGQLSVAFTAPGSDGGASITNYDYSIDDGDNWVTPSTPSTTSPVVITGLTNATAYPVKIRARNSVGDGTASNSVSGTPVAPPSSSGSGSSGSVYVAPVVVPEIIPSTVKQITIRKATDNKPARLVGKSLGKDVFFVADSAKLSAAAKKTLRQAARLAITSGSKVAVTGFAAASPKGTKFEKRLAESRALRVANFLRKQGLENWIYFHGLNSRQGSELPGQPRRVEIRVLK